jgi:hypothetical protein
MPVSHHFKDDLLMFKAQGSIALDDFFRAWNDFTTDPSFQVPVDMLIDLREAQVDVPGQKMESIVYHLAYNRFFNRMVFVAERGTYTYAMSRMFCSNAECAGCCSEIFHTVTEALAWLNAEHIDAPVPTPTSAG